MTTAARPLALPIALALGLVSAAAGADSPPPPRVAVTQAAAAAAPAQPAAPTAAQVQASTAEARRMSDAFVAVAERVSPSVVMVDVTARDEKVELLSHFFGRSGAAEPVARGMGSGVVYSADGAILTNNHVVEEALSIAVRLRDGRHLPARLVGRDPATDLAVIKVDATGLTTAKFADSEAARVGEWAVAIGSPFGLGYSVTAGVLSAKARGGLGMNAIEDYLQTDASINPGNSGGPLCNLQGEVLGINTMIVGKGQGIGFAVPSSLAVRVADQLLKTGHVSRAWMGLAVQDLTPELATALKAPAGAGALVNDVPPEGPAYRANVRPGDLIASVDGHPVHDGHDLIRETLSHEVGQSVSLEIVRAGQHYGASVKLTERPEEPVGSAPAQAAAGARSGMGLVVRDLAPQQVAEMGLGARPLPIVTQVAPGSPADRAGLRPGDVIVQANETDSPTSPQVADLARSGTLLLRCRRGESYYYAAIKK
jgi:Do/DeqQ family serine protease